MSNSRINNAFLLRFEELIMELLNIFHEFP